MNTRLIRLAVAAAATSAICLGVASSADAGTHSPTPGRVDQSYTGYLNDGSGAGNAATPKPGTHASAGTPIYSLPDGSGAWLVVVHQPTTGGPCGGGYVTSTCPFTGKAAWENGILNGDALTWIHPKAASGYCYRDASGKVNLGTCNGTSADMMWVWKGHYVYNVYGTDVNANGNPLTLSNPGAGKQVAVLNIGAASNYHQLWGIKGLVCSTSNHQLVSTSNPHRKAIALHVLLRLELQR